MNGGGDENEKSMKSDLHTTAPYIFVLFYLRDWAATITFMSH